MSEIEQIKQQLAQWRQSLAESEKSVEYDTDEESQATADGSMVVNRLETESTDIRDRLDEMRRAMEDYEVISNLMHQAPLPVATEEADAGSKSEENEKQGPDETSVPEVSEAPRET